MLADVDIPAIRARGDLTEREKTLAIYVLKVDAIADWLINGKPSPNPIPPVLNRVYTLNSVTYTVKGIRVETLADGVKVLLVQGIAVKSGVTKNFNLRIVNPPILTRDLREHYIDAAAEMIEGAVKWP